MPDAQNIANEILDKNRVYRDAMIKLISSDEAIAFVGAGLSTPLKYPSWKQLLEKLHFEANNIATFNPLDSIKNDALLYAEEIKEHFKNHNKFSQFKNILGREFGPKDPNCSDTHKLLIKLPFRAFVTTNYDGCLEQALNEHAAPRQDLCTIIKQNGGDRHTVSRFLRSIVKSNDVRHVAHIHGWFDDTDNIVLSASDYAMAYGFEVDPSTKRISKGNPLSTLHRQLIWSLLATRQLIFFGCSMEDPYIKLMLDAVTEALWEWKEKIHFVVLPLDEASLDKHQQQMKEFEQYGLQVVFFNNCDGTFRSLNQLLEECHQKCFKNPPDSSGVVNANNSEISSQSNSFQTHATNPYGGEWLEEINRETVKALKKNEN